MNWFSKSKTKDVIVPAPAPDVRTMIRVSQSLSPETIAVYRQEPQQRELFGWLIDRLRLPEPDIALRSVLAREAIGSTVIEKGMALPHARVPGLTSIHAALALIPSAKVNICLLFVGPTGDMKGHLGFLASSAALFQKEEFRQALLRLEDSRQIFERIQLEERGL